MLRRPSQLIPLLLSLAIAPAACFASGTLLAAFAVPPLLWAVACAVIMYLVWSTTEALFLSNLWLLGLFAMVVGLRPWPAAWESFSAWEDARLWALTLLGLWASQVLLLWGLAWASEQWQRLDPRLGQRGEKHRGRCWSLGLLCCLGLSSGFWAFR
jgi:hypothetical protein